MDKQAYHYNKKKMKGKTPGTYRYFYPCDPADNGVAWRYWKRFVKKGYMPDHVDVEIEYNELPPFNDLPY